MVVSLHSPYSTDAKPLVAVDYECIKYVIPADEGESMHALSLISLLTSKQSAGGLPATTGVVTTISK